MGALTTKDMNDIAREIHVMVGVEGAVKKWQGIFDGTGADSGTANCPLCALFEVNRCEGCPVAERVGKNGCSDTPYTEWVDHHMMTERHSRYRPYSVHTDCKECAELAGKVLDFIKSFLPEQNQMEVK